MFAVAGAVGKPKGTQLYFANQRGATASVDGRLGDAEQAFREALELSPRNPTALFNLARVLHDTGRIDAAKDVYRRCLRSDPKFVPALLNLAALTLGDDQETATQLVERAVQAAPTNVDARLSLGSLLIEQGRVEEGTKHLRRAARLDPALSTRVEHLIDAARDPGDSR